MEIRDDAWDCTLIQRMKEHGDTTVNAIYEWSDRDVWDFIKDRKIEINPLYEMGFRRVGCVLCPLSTHAEKLKEIELFPTYKQAYINTFERLRECKENIRERWKSGEEMFNWWIEQDAKQVPGQMTMEIKSDGSGGAIWWDKEPL